MSCDGCSKGDCPRSDAPCDAQDVIAAAQLIRQARNTLREASVDDRLIEQMRAVCDRFPDRALPHVVLIELLLKRGELNTAQRHVASALLAWPNCRRLVMNRCRWLILMTEFNAAVSELHHWLATQPWDGQAHVLAGEAAALDGEHELAAGHFALAAAHTRTRTQRRRLLARAHIESEQFTAAQQWLVDVGRPCPRLEGLLAARRGQLLDASEFLARATADHNGHWLARQIATTELLDVRRRLGNPTAMRAAVDRITLRQPLAWAAAAESLLSIGRASEAALRAAQLQRICRRHVLAGHVLVVASALNDSPAVSRRTMRRLNGEHVDVNTLVMSRLWRHGLLSRIVRQQRDARRSGADPQAHRLQPLLERANRVLEQPLRAGHPEATNTRVRNLHQLRQTCLIALGRPLSGPAPDVTDRHEKPLRLAA